MAAINYKGEPVRSDAKWYFDRCSGEADIFDGIFFEMCKRFNVRWSAATPKEKLFIEGITRFEYEKDYAKRMGLPTDFILKMVDYLKKALIYGHTSRISS